jgi:hypothetical protein
VATAAILAIYSFGGGVNDDYDMQAARTRLDDRKTKEPSAGLKNHRSRPKAHKKHRYFNYFFYQRMKSPSRDGRTAQQILRQGVGDIGGRE